MYRSYTGWWWQYYTLRDVFMHGSVSLSSGRTDMKAVDYLIIIADQMHTYMTSVFPTGNKIFQQDNVPFHKV